MNNQPEQQGLSKSSTSPCLSNTTNTLEQRLFAVCEPRSTFELKQLIKSHSLFSTDHPVCKSPGLSKIPLSIKEKILGTELNHVDILREDDGNGEVELPLVFSDNRVPSPIWRSKHLIGFQWIPVNCVKSRPNASPVIKTLKEFISSVPVIDCSLIDQLTIPGYEAYNQLIIFQSNSFTSEDWHNKLFRGINSERERFFKLLARNFGVTHLASKGFIQRDDQVRKPWLKELYGKFDRLGQDFDQDGFDSSFWTCTKVHLPARQLSIRYVWSPTHTMYCRGNNSEKIRIGSDLSDLRNKVVVDMFAGIGFFSFCYLAGGAQKVIGCEISRWAVEGMRRGSVENGFNYRIIDKGYDESVRFRESMEDEHTRLIILPFSNQQGLRLYRGLAEHVNLGLLPDSIPFVQIAIEALRPDLGGHIHVHTELDLILENQPKDNLSAAQKSAQRLIEKILSLQNFRIELVDCVGIYFVKPIGPQKYHVVFQIRVGPYNYTV
ncbi:S-adenosyl-L-methionine-dependent methyltransferase [Phakopsora pachyrhizi]|nr:S-adenosyl-L-methionine-dependent methyltransferase [Phakopsora pachyrhizi]